MSLSYDEFISKMTIFSPFRKDIIESMEFPILNQKTGNVESLSAAEMYSGVKSGKYTFENGRINLDPNLGDSSNSVDNSLGYDNAITKDNVSGIKDDKQGQYSVLSQSNQLKTATVEFIGLSRFSGRGGGKYSPTFSNKKTVAEKSKERPSQLSEFKNKSREESEEEEDPKGYLLSDPWHYPILENNNVKKPITNGDKIEVSGSDVVTNGNKYSPYTIDSTNNKMKIKIGTVEKELTLSSGTKNIDDIVSELNTLLNSTDCEFVNYQDKIRIKGKSGNNIELVKQENSACKTLGFEFGVYVKETDRVISVTKYEPNCHPKGLLSCSAITLNANGEITGGVPTASNHWLYNVQDDTPQNFVVDLMNVPFESSRRDWRYEAPSWNMSNAVCNNPNCPIGARKFSVSQWIGFIQTGVRQYPVPSLTSKYCSSCGSDLTKVSGAMQISGDNTKSYYYYDYFSKNAFLTYIVVDSVGTIPALTAYKTSYSIQIKVDGQDYWQTIISVYYFKSQNKYFWIDLDGESHLEATVPTEWDLRPFRIRARYVRFVSISNRYETTIVGTNGSWDSTNKRYNISGDYTEGYFVDCKIMTGSESKDGQPIYEITRNIVNSSKQGTQNYVYIDGEIPNNHKYYKIIKYLFIGGCAKFEVYGINYIESDVTITPPADIETFVFTGGATSFTMTNQPTQICSVYAGSVEFNVELESYELSSDVNIYDQADFRWTTTKYDVTDTDGNTHKVKLITGGKYFYKYSTNQIILPELDSDGDDIYSINSDVPSDIFSREIIPSIITVQYWQGAGVGFEVPIVPEGRGPSYQLEREAINSVLTEMDGLGESVPLLGDTSSYKRELNWFCYNHEPTIWKQERKYLNGTELGTDWSLGKFKEVFGEAACLVGRKATGKVTIYGASDICVSGTVLVEAPKETKHKLGDIEWTERTGGFADAGFLIGVQVNPDGGHRQSLAYTVPEVIIYAKDKIIE